MEASQPRETESLKRRHPLILPPFSFILRFSLRPPLAKLTSLPLFPRAMQKTTILRRLVEPGVIAIIRANSSDQLLEAAHALHAGGVTAMEVTMTTPNALKVISEVSAHFGSKVLMGVGSVLDPETCRAAILAGAEFVVTPVTKPEIIRLANRYGKPIVAGAFTPTEMLVAHESGADFIKLFPADNAGPGFIKSVLAPLPMLQIVPTGGITPENAAEYLDAGAVALGAGSALVSSEILKARDWDKLRSRAEAFVRAVKR
jgi:2-dehydro-3-deoxyphosphogluconate aldolase/(4S)-4-hydroxy-2-oxoglutarate aldolase